MDILTIKYRNITALGTEILLGFYSIMAKWRWLGSWGKKLIKLLFGWSLEAHSGVIYGGFGGIFWGFELNPSTLIFLTMTSLKNIWMSRHVPQKRGGQKWGGWWDGDSGYYPY